MSYDLLAYGIGLLVAVVAFLAWADGVSKGKW
jgi:hypothetical protein